MKVIRKEGKYLSVDEIVAANIPSYTPIQIQISPSFKNENLRGRVSERRLVYYGFLESSLNCLLVYPSLIESVDESSKLESIDLRSIDSIITLSREL